MKINRTGKFRLDSIIYGGEEENDCSGEEITPELIAQIKQGIAEKEICFIQAMTEDDRDQFHLEIDTDMVQGKDRLDIDITYTDDEDIEYAFMFCDTSHIRQDKKIEELTDEEQDALYEKSSSCYDFGLAAEIFEKWALTGEIYPRLWWRQWDDGEDHFELTEMS